MSAPLFAFAQLDLASGYGLTPGRYPLRPEGRPTAEPEGVLVLASIDALVGRPRRRRGRAKPREVSVEDSGPTVQVQRATVIRAEPFAGVAHAEAWLAETQGDEAKLAATVEWGLLAVNRALHAHRSAAQDAYVPDVSAERTLAARIGFGPGDALASGRWSEAVDVPPSAPRVRRAESLRPQERVARVLGGHETVGPCEALLLRARADLDAGRSREAALELQSAVAALLVELGGTGGPEQAADLADLDGRRDALAAMASTALRSAPPRADLEDGLRLAERVIRRRLILG